MKKIKYIINIVLLGLVLYGLNHTRYVQYLQQKYKWYVKNTGTYTYVKGPYVLFLKNNKYVKYGILENLSYYENNSYKIYRDDDNLRWVSDIEKDNIYYDTLSNIDDLFDSIERNLWNTYLHLNMSGDDISVIYNDEYGYPEHLEYLHAKDRIILGGESSYHTLFLIMYPNDFEYNDKNLIEILKKYAEIKHDFTSSEGVH